MRDLDQSEIDSIFRNRCPACGATTEGFYRGAEGGAAFNIYCANVDECGAGYTLVRVISADNPLGVDGGRLFKPSKLGDVRAPPPVEVWRPSPWFAYVLLFAVGFVVALAAVLLIFVR